MKNTEEQIIEKKIESILIASLRMTAPYSECGAGFAKLMKNYARWNSGSPFLLCYDRDYQEVANFEVCIGLRKKPDREVDGITLRELPGGHRGIEIVLNQIGL